MRVSRSGWPGAGTVLPLLLGCQANSPSAEPSHAKPAEVTQTSATAEKRLPQSPEVVASNDSGAMRLRPPADPTRLERVGPTSSDCRLVEPGSTSLLSESPTFGTPQERAEQDRWLEIQGDACLPSTAYPLIKRFVRSVLGYFPMTPWQDERIHITTCWKLPANRKQPAGWRISLRYQFDHDTAAYYDKSTYTQFQVILNATFDRMLEGCWGGP